MLDPFVFAVFIGSLSFFLLVLFSKPNTQLSSALHCTSNTNVPQPNPFENYPSIGYDSYGTCTFLCKDVYSSTIDVQSSNEMQFQKTPFIVLPGNTQQGEPRMQCAFAYRLSHAVKPQEKESTSTSLLVHTLGFQHSQTSVPNFVIM